MCVCVCSVSFVADVVAVVDRVLPGDFQPGLTGEGSTVPQPSLMKGFIGFFLFHFLFFFFTEFSFSKKKEKEPGRFGDN